MFDIFNMLKKDENTAAPKQVTRETIIGDILDMDQTTAPYFMEIGMHCLGSASRSPASSARVTASPSICRHCSPCRANSSASVSVKRR